MFDNLPSSIEHIRGGRLRALAVSTTTRLEGFPDLPTIGEFVSGFETSAFAGLGAPEARLPRSSTSSTVRSMPASPMRPCRRASQRSAAFRCRLSSAEFGKFFADETEKSGQGRQVLRRKSKLAQETYSVSLETDMLLIHCWSHFRTETGFHFS